jgi:hypothetical protein
VDNTAEVRYAGVVVGRGALKELPDGAGAFVSIPEPLPVGTAVSLKVGDAVREARVDDVVEAADPGATGMRVLWGAVRPASVTVVAAPAPVEAAAPVATTDSGSAEVPMAMGDGGPGESGPNVAAEASDEGSGAIQAPLALASPSGDGAQQGGGKRRRKRR